MVTISALSINNSQSIHSMADTDANGWSGEEATDRSLITAEQLIEAVQRDAMAKGDPLNVQDANEVNRVVLLCPPSRWAVAPPLTTRQQVIDEFVGFFNAAVALLDSQNDRVAAFALLGPVCKREARRLVIHLVCSVGLRTLGFHIVLEALRRGEVALVLVALAATPWRAEEPQRSGPLLASVMAMLREVNPPDTVVVGATISAASSDADSPLLPSTASMNYDDSNEGALQVGFGSSRLLVSGRQVRHVVLYDLEDFDRVMAVLSALIAAGANQLEDLVIVNGRPALTASVVRPGDASASAQASFVDHVCQLLAQQGAALRSVLLPGCGLDDADVCRILSALPSEVRLHRVSFSMNPRLALRTPTVREALLRMLRSSADCLRTLAVAHTSVDDDAVRCLCDEATTRMPPTSTRAGCRALVRLELQHTKVTKVGIQMAVGTAAPQAKGFPGLGVLCSVEQSAALEDAELVADCGAGTLAVLDQNLRAPPGRAQIYERRLNALSHTHEIADCMKKYSPFTVLSTSTEQPEGRRNSNGDHDVQRGVFSPAAACEVSSDPRNAAMSGNSSPPWRRRGRFQGKN